MMNPVKNNSMVSVIICTYNRCESLRDTLKALLNQTLPGDISVEILVVDNNSNDQTKEVVARFSELAVFPLRYIFEENQGISFARNRGILEAQGDFLAFTDDDVIPSKDWVRNIRSAFSDFNADIVGGPIRPLWQSTPPQWLLNPEFQVHLALLDKGPEVIIRERGTTCDFLYGANMSFKRNVFEKIGGFRTDLGNRGYALLLKEDSEMLSRALRAGSKVVYAPDVQVQHKVLPQRMGLKYLRRWRFASGRSNTIHQYNSGKLPLWVVRECLQNGLLAIICYLGNLREKALCREMLFWFQLGSVFENVARQFGVGKVCNNRE